MSGRNRGTCGLGAMLVFGILPVWLAIAAPATATPDAGIGGPSGVWVSQRGNERLFLVLYADGQYRMARARAALRDLAVQWDEGRFAVGPGWVTLTAQPADCRYRLEGAFRFRFVGAHLRLESANQAFTFGRLRGQQAAAVTTPPPAAIYGCFEGDQFVPRRRAEPS